MIIDHMIVEIKNTIEITTTTGNKYKIDKGDQNLVSNIHEGYFNIYSYKSYDDSYYGMESFRDVDLVLSVKEDLVEAISYE